MIICSCSENAFKNSTEQYSCLQKKHIKHCKLYTIFEKSCCKWDMFLPTFLTFRAFSRCLLSKVIHNKYICQKISTFVIPGTLPVVQIVVCWIHTLFLCFYIISYCQAYFLTSYMLIVIINPWTVSFTGWEAAPWCRPHGASVPGAGKGAYRVREAARARKDPQRARGTATTARAAALWTGATPHKEALWHGRQVNAKT